MKIGDYVIKNPKTWVKNDFDGWGRGIGVGIIIEPPYEVEDIGLVDVRWPNGRCFEEVTQLIVFHGKLPSETIDQFVTRKTKERKNG